jgi:hypothetical protein
MSHVVTIETLVRDPAAISLACERLKLPSPRHGTFELFATQATGWSVQLPGWTFPIVCDTQSGKVLYDNFEERWGSTSELNTFLQRYAVEAARLAARRQGHTVLEQAQADGSIRLVIQAGGAA